MLALLLVSQIHCQVPLQEIGSCSCHAYLGESPAQAQPISEWPDSRRRSAGQMESHLLTLRQLTFGGQNAEAYWNLDGTKIVYQTRQPEFPDEQIFLMNADGSQRRLVSTGLGRCTCSYFSPDGKYIYFSSTHSKNKGAQQPIDMSKGYVWMINPEFSLWRVNVDGTGLTKVLEKPGYVAETTISPQGDYMTFTGAWDGDIDIYRSDLAGNNISKLTSAHGYDGGPFVSWDGKKIVYRRSSEFSSKAERDTYDDLLAQNLVRPSRMDIWIMDSNGRNKRKVTDLGKASFAPFLHPNGKQIIFSSNHHDPDGREFDLFMIGTNGKNLKQVTFTPEFDGFPMFSRDGKKLIFASNRFGSVYGETNIFVADWAE